MCTYFYSKNSYLSVRYSKGQLYRSLPRSMDVCLNCMQLQVVRKICYDKKVQVLERCSSSSKLSLCSSCIKYAGLRRYY